MRRVVFVALAVAAAFALDAGAATGPYAGKPPMIGGDTIVPSLVAVDVLGSRYVAGTFTLTADFDPGKGVALRTAHGAGPKPFVTKFDSKGAWAWTQTFGGTGTDGVSALAVVGFTVFAAGSFTSNDAGFGGTGTISAHTDASNYVAGYVFALDSVNGAPVTAFNGTGVQTFSGDGGGVDGGRATATSLAASGDLLFVGGSFTSDGFGIGGSGALNATGRYDGFVAALDRESGAAQTSFGAGGVQAFGGGGDEFVRCLASSDARLYVGGDTSSTDFGVGGKGTVSTGQFLNADAFVAALDVGTGAPLTAFGGDGVVTFGGLSGTEAGVCLATAPGVVYLAGDTNSPDAKVDGVGAPAPLIGVRDLFVLALDAATGARMPTFAGGVQVFGPVEDTGAPTALVAKPGAVYVAGSLSAAGAGVGGPGPAPQADAFVVALDPATGGALAGFATDGVVAVNGALAGAGRVSAQILGMARPAIGLLLAGNVPAGASLGAVPFPSGGACLVAMDASTGDPLNMGVNRRPVFATPLIATPNPAVRGRPIRFKMNCSDPDGDKLTLQWLFGDGTFTGERSPRKSFQVPGKYAVQVTAVDPHGARTQSDVLDLVVNPETFPYFDITKAAVSLKFSAHGGDSVVVSGQAPVPDGDSLNGKVFAVDVGGVADSFKLDAFGRSLRGDQMVVVSRPRGNVSKFTVTLTHGDYAEQFADEGMVDATVAGLYTPVVVKVTFYGETYSETMPLFYTARHARSGSAK